MHHPPKRYTDEAQIIKDIDRAKKRVVRLTKRAEKEDAEADEMAKLDDPSNSEKITTLREFARDDRDKAERITKTRLVRLQNTLAAFRTELLPGVAADNSVTLQRK
jgi:hypothetical protein